MASTPIPGEEGNEEEQRESGSATPSINLQAQLIKVEWSKEMYQLCRE
jgi:hypothetical protein